MNLYSIVWYFFILVEVSSLLFTGTISLLVFTFSSLFPPVVVGAVVPVFVGALGAVVPKVVDSITGISSIFLENSNTFKLSILELNSYSSSSS